MNDLCYNSEPPGLNYMPLSGMRGLGDFSAAAALGYTADQIYAAVQELADFVNGAHAIYDQHFNWYQQNAASLSPDVRTAYSNALNDESSNLQQLDQALQEAQYYVSGAANPSGLSGLGDLGISFTGAIIITALIGLSIVAMITLWKISSDNTAQIKSDNEVKKQTSESSQVEQNRLHQLFESGQLTAQDYLKRSAEIDKKTMNQPIDWQPLVGAGVLIALIIGGVELAK